MPYSGVAKSLVLISVSGWLGGLSTFSGQKLLVPLNSVDFKENFSGQYFLIGFLGSLSSAFLMSVILKIRACLRHNPPDDFFNSFSMLDSLIKLGLAGVGSLLILLVTSAIVNQANQILRPLVASFVGSMALAIGGGSLNLVFKAAVLLFGKKPVAAVVTPVDLETGSVSTAATRPVDLITPTAPEVGAQVAPLVMGYGFGAHTDSLGSLHSFTDETDGTDGTDGTDDSGDSSDEETVVGLPWITPANTPLSPLPSPRDLSGFSNVPASPPAGTGEAPAVRTPSPAFPLFYGNFVAGSLVGGGQNGMIHAP